MGIVDKAKDLIINATETLRDPDKNLVENTWPAGQPDDEHLPSQTDGAEDVVEQGAAQAEPQPPHTEPVTGADPELDHSIEDQYQPGHEDNEGRS